ncbi:MAG: response regulator [Candidatus Omnitrophica bacterium]|nr:response regulator [Candidatus Omnitrophota bacterium]
MDRKINVLVVDDERDFVYTLEYWLKSKGYSVVTANNGKEALDRMKEGTVDIIFLDLHMPVMDGVETIKNIRQINKDIPVVIITAYTVDEKVSEVERYNVAGFFSKDKDFSESAALLETILRRHNILRQ